MEKKDDQMSLQEHTNSNSVTKETNQSQLVLK